MEIYTVRAETLCRFLEAVAAQGGTSLSAIATFAGSTPKTATRALPVLQALDLVTWDEERGWTVSHPELGRGVGDEELRQVLRAALLRFRPFELFCEGLAHGESEAEALRKAAVMAGIRRADRSKLTTLVSWGLALDLLERDETGLVQLRPDLVTSDPEDWTVLSREEVDSAARARLYIGRRLGREVMKLLDAVDEDLLQEALLSFRSAPRAAAEKAGQFLENFLRKVASDKGFGAQAKKCNGAGQLASLLKQHALIHKNHVHWIQALAALRNATGHSKDKLTGRPWNLDEHSGFWGLSATLSVSRSVYRYAYDKQQVI